LSGVVDSTVIADMAYDSAALRELIATHGNQAVIPSNPTRARQHELDRHTYKERWLVEDFFRKIKRYRRVATRYEKTARMFLAFVVVASILVWLA
jgi:transposase